MSMMKNKNMRVSLLNPNIGIDYIADSLGLAYLASSLDKKGYSTTIIDAQNDQLSNSEILLSIKQTRPYLIGVTLNYQEYVNEIIKQISYLRNHGIHLPIVVGGIFPTNMHKEILLNVPEIDYVIRGEGEVPIVKLLETLLNDGELVKVPNLTYRDKNNNIVVNNRFEPITRMDLIPHPSRKNIKTLVKNGRRIAIQASRGCYGDCSFCSIRQIYNLKRCRRFSPKYVIEEIDILVQKFNVRKLWFIDDIFYDKSIQSKNWICTFIDLLEKREYNLDIWIQLRASDIDFQSLEKLKKIGFSFR